MDNKDTPNNTLIASAKMQVSTRAIPILCELIWACVSATNGSTYRPIPGSESAPATVRVMTAKRLFDALQRFCRTSPSNDAVLIRTTHPNMAAVAIGQQQNIRIVIGFSKDAIEAHVYIKNRALPKYDLYNVLQAWSEAMERLCLMATRHDTVTLWKPAEPPTPVLEVPEHVDENPVV